MKCGAQKCRCATPETKPNFKRQERLRFYIPDTVELHGGAGGPRAAPGPPPGPLPPTQQQPLEVPPAVQGGTAPPNEPLTVPAPGTK
jgi:hypothetical protein